MARTFQQRLQAIDASRRAAGLSRLVALHDGAHFIEKPDPVLVLTGFKTMGPSAVIVDDAGRTTLIVTPAWDEGRAGEARADTVLAVDNLAEGFQRLGSDVANDPTGLVGFAAAPVALAQPIAGLFQDARAADDLVFDAAARKIDTEIADAREAARIAELNFARMLEVIRPGLTEDELAVELRQHSRELGADDNFLLLRAAPHNMAVAPSNGRQMQKGDIVIVELTPSVGGQLVQICRTLVLGEADPVLKDKYALVVSAMQDGIAAAKPGATMADICAAINAPLEALGYGEYCHPPHIRRRGHGLGFGANRPGDVALDNLTGLEPDMLFMIHPNQYLPERGYMLCGEPVLMGEDGAVPLTREQARLYEVGL